jgi:hypothetical protein
MATDLNIINNQNIQDASPDCNCADQCCWYETTVDSGAACANRTALVCQIRREEVFGQAVGSRLQFN